MQLDFLETFLDLMETKSFNATAERMSITQSTVSSRINVLESALGRPLFTRSRGGTQPTAAGLRFADHARAMLLEWNSARRAVQRAQNFTQSMRIGLQNDLAATQIGDWVSGFRAAMPDTAFYVELDYSVQMCANLLAGDLDLAVLFTPRHLPDLWYENVGEIRYRLISTKATRVADIDRDSYILANYSPLFEEAHRRLLPNLIEAPLSSGQNATICQLLKTLGGSAFVLEEAARGLCQTGQCHYIEDIGAIHQPVYLAVHVRRRHLHTHKKLLTIVRRHFAGNRFPALQATDTGSGTGWTKG